LLYWIAKDTLKSLDFTVQLLVAQGVCWCWERSCWDSWQLAVRYINRL